MQRIMRHLGHAAVNLIKVDIEGAELLPSASSTSLEKRCVLDELIATPGLEQLSFELHGGYHDQWFRFYEQLMRRGFHLVAGSGVRYRSSNAAHQWVSQHDKSPTAKDGRFGFRHCRATNYTSCRLPMGELTFYRPPNAEGPAAWWYDSVYQEQTE